MDVLSSFYGCLSIKCKAVAKVVVVAAADVVFFCFFSIYFIYPFAIKKKESREGEGSKPSIETMYSNFYIKILLYIYIVSI